MLINNPLSDGSGLRLPLMKPDAVRGRMLISPAAGVGGQRDWEDFQVGRAIIPDFGYRSYGALSFDKPFTKIVVPDGAPPPEIPDTPGRKWQTVIELPVLDVESGVLFLFSNTGQIGKPSINQNRIASILTLWGYQPQAAQGLLQKFLTRPFTEVMTVNGPFQGLVWEPVDDWFERTNPPFPSPRLQPPPSVILTGPPPAPKLAAPIAAAVTETQAVPAPDPLAKFRPVSGKRPPGY
jgi:hypothetical protein